MESWRTILEFNNYEASNYGNVRRKGSARNLTGTSNGHGYLCVTLRKNNKGFTKAIHSLVAICYLGHVPNKHTLVINHKDLNKLNNNKSNLEITTTRDNTNKLHIKSTSEYIGVSWLPKKNRWLARIRIGKHHKQIGTFKNDVDAHNAYMKILKEIS